MYYQSARMRDLRLCLVRHPSVLVVYHNVTVIRLLPRGGQLTRVVNLSCMWPSRWHIGLGTDNCLLFAGVPVACAARLPCRQQLDSDKEVHGLCQSRHKSPAFRHRAASAAEKDVW